MSRYAINEPDPDRYEAKPVEDIDVPDFDAADEPIDPAEHDAQAALVALRALETHLLKATDLDRVLALRKLARAIWTKATAVCDLAAARSDEDLERRR